MKELNVIGPKDECFLCGQNGHSDPLNRHEIFYGSGRRQLSIEDGLCVMLCHSKCHQNGPESVHMNHDVDLRLKRIGQRYALVKHGWTVEQFIERYGKNYILEDDEACGSQSLDLSTTA